MTEPLSGTELIAEERQRQIDVEGWLPEHDAEHADHELVRAAYCYLLASRAPLVLEENERVEASPPKLWPWEARWWKPSPSPVRNLVKAGALIAAEIDRLTKEEKP